MSEADERNLPDTQGSAPVASVPALSKRDYAALRATVAKEATDDEIYYFVRYCIARKLDPFAEHIHLIKRGGQISYQIGIHGKRTIAERSGNHLGEDAPLFYDEKTDEWIEFWDRDYPPSAAKVVIHKLLPNGKVWDVPGIARWKEYYPGEQLGFMWRKMPSLMLAKCAASRAYDIAYPTEVGGTYDKAEIALIKGNEEEAEIERLEREAEERDRHAEIKKAREQEILEAEGESPTEEPPFEPKDEAPIITADDSREMARQFWLLVRKMGYARDQVHEVLKVESCAEIVKDKQKMDKALKTLHENKNKKSKKKSASKKEPPKEKKVWPDEPTQEIVQKYIKEELQPETEEVYIDEGDQKVPLFMLLTSARDKKGSSIKDRLLACRNYLVRADRPLPEQLTKWLEKK